jgi:succinate dehydrogenase/fumarate reductase flavoprotein subunit
MRAREATEVDEFDVVVLGTGAAGLTAAIRASAGEASVGLFEKLDRIGGTAAWSGGRFSWPARECDPSGDHPDAP